MKSNLEGASAMFELEGTLEYQWKAGNCAENIAISLRTLCVAVHVDAPFIEDALAASLSINQKTRRV